jgi:putative holliday junction resolvase
MQYLGIDWGEKRIGLSYGNEVGVAVPLPAATQAKKNERFAYMARIIAKHKITQLVIGYPFHIDGTVGNKIKQVDCFIKELKKQFGLPVHCMDEHLTTFSAKAQTSKTALKSKRYRKSGQLDSKAATLILQDYFDLHFSD